MAEVCDWNGVQTILEENFAALDVVPLCIKIVSYSKPPRNIWANRTFLQLLNTSLDTFRGQVQSQNNYRHHAPIINSGERWPRAYSAGFPLT